MDRGRRAQVNEVARTDRRQRAEIFAVREQRIQRAQLMIVRVAVARNDVAGERDFRSQRQAPEAVPRLGPGTPCPRAVAGERAELGRGLGFPISGAVVAELSRAEGLRHLPAGARSDRFMSSHNAETAVLHARRHHDGAGPDALPVLKMAQNAPR